MFSKRSLVPTLEILSNGEHVVTEKVQLRKKMTLLVKMLVLLQPRLCWVRPCLAEGNGSGSDAKARQARLATPGALPTAVFRKPSVISCIWNMFLLHCTFGHLPHLLNEEYVGAPLRMTAQEEGMDESKVRALPILYYGVGGERAGKATHGSNPSNKDSVLAVIVMRLGKDRGL